MEIPLSLWRKGDAMIYGIPLWYRIVSVAIAAVIVAAVATSGNLNVFGILAAAVTCFAALYEERWIFDRSAGTVQGKLGLVIASRGPRLAVDDVARVRVDLFAKGKLDQQAVDPAGKLPPGSQVRLIIDAKDGESYMLDSVSARRRARIDDAAKQLSAFLGVELA